MNGPTRFSEDVKQVSEFKTSSAEIIAQIRRTRRPVFATRSRCRRAVDVDEYERLVERRVIVEAVEAGAKAAADGELHPHEEAFAILETFGNGNG